MRSFTTFCCVGLLCLVFGCKDMYDAPGGSDAAPLPEEDRGVQVDVEGRRGGVHVDVDPENGSVDVDVEGQPIRDAIRDARERREAREGVEVDADVDVRADP